MYWFLCVEVQASASLSSEANSLPWLVGSQPVLLLVWVFKVLFSPCGVEVTHCQGASILQEVLVRALYLACSESLAW